nr:hypothetical protein [Candidatus Peribacteraceae bacterium]
MPENTPQSAIQEFIRAVGTPADNQPWDPRSSVLPRDEVRDNRLVTHPITAEELNRLKESLWGDNLIQGFEELTEFNQVQRELLRLKQELSGASPEQRQIAEYRISYLQTNLRMILGNRTNLQLQAGFSKRISELNLKVTIDPTIERNLVAHMQPLTGAIQARVSLAQLGLLFMRKSEGKTVSDEEINQARRQIPRTIQVWNTEQNKEETVTLNPDAWQSAGMLQDPAFASAVLGLENQIDRLLTYDESVPGVSTEALGLNPVDVYYVEYLSVVREKISERRKAIRLETGSQATAEDEKLKKLEDDIITELSQFVWRNQRQQIGTLDDVSRSFFDTTYAPQGNEGDPPIFTQKQIESVATIDRVNFGRQVEAIRERFHDRAVQVMGGANSDGDPVKGLFDQSIFDLGDWKLYSEDVYKDHGRFKIVYPVLEAAAHVGVAPEVIRKYLNPLEMNATFSDKVEDVMVHVRRAWKLPDVITVDGETVPFDVREPKHWDALSPEQWQEIEASQKSTLDQLNQNKEKFKNSLGNIEWNLQSFQQLYELKNPDQMVDQEPDIATLDSLLSSETTLDELLADPEVLKAAPAKLVACYYYLFFKLQQNADAYAELSHDMQLGFDEISDQGLDAMGHLKDAKDQANNWWIYGLFGALGYVIARKVPVLGKTLRFGEKIGWHAGRGAVNLIRRTPRVTPAQRAIRGSRLANELTKTRDMPGEKALLEMLEKTRAGRWVSNLKFVRNASVANGANKVIKYGSFAVIPAVGLYEAYLTHERVKSANGNAQLQAEYAKEYKTTALETSGYLAAALLSFGPQVVLTAPVYYTGSYNRNRAEVKNGWAREAADWNREFDSTGLMGQLRKATSLNAVEAG